jgi:hypothetical protein
MKTLIFVIGASGAGKTATLEALEAEKPENIVFCYFDRIGVPSPKEMSRDFGSGEDWQSSSLECTLLIAGLLECPFLTQSGHWFCYDPSS